MVGTIDGTHVGSLIISSTPLRHLGVDGVSRLHDMNEHVMHAANTLATRGCKIVLEVTPLTRPDDDVRVEVYASDDIIQLPWTCSRHAGRGIKVRGGEIECPECGRTVQEEVRAQAIEDARFAKPDGENGRFGGNA